MTPIPGIGRRAAQRLARAELSKPVYHRRPPLTERIIAAILGWLRRLFHVASSVPGGWWGLVALAALAVVVAAVILGWIGPVARSGRRARELAPAGAAMLTARQHRELAGRLAGAGEYAVAICERMRAIAAELDERGVLAPRAGRTADEFAGEAGQALPAQAAGLRAAAMLFDEVRYGQRAGNLAGYQQLRDLDGKVRASAGRLAPAAAPAPTAMTGGPR